MHRRTVLAAVGSSSAALAGCLADGALSEGSETESEADDERTDDAETNAGDGPDCHREEPLERCGRLIVSDDAFPAAVRCEIDAAFDAGAYDTDGDLLLERAMDVENAYVRRDGTAYEPNIVRDGESTTLRFVEADELTLREPYEMSVANRADEDRTVTVSIGREGESVADRTLAVAAGDRERLEVSDVLGRYEIAVETDDGLAETFESRIGEYFRFGLSTSEENVTLSESTADVLPCQWD